ncbi:MAG: helix-turn-helix domain-containing protein [Nanoarchaeota archaeon]
MDIQILEDIGLTPAEIKVYLALLELGTATAGPILDKTGLQNSVVHMTLNRLIEKGFVSFVKEGKRNHYQAANPKHILEYMDEKKERFEMLLPSLLMKQNQANEKPEIISFRGKKGVKELLYELLSGSGKEYHTLNSPYASIMMGDHFWITFHKKRVSQGVKARQVFNESLRTWVKEIKYTLSQLRYTKKGFEPLTETIIFGNQVAILIWAEKPVGILMKNPTIAESYDRYFEMVWEQAKV